MQLIPLVMNRCPALRLRLDLATPKVPEEFMCGAYRGVTENPSSSESMEVISEPCYTTSGSPVPFYVLDVCAYHPKLISTWFSYVCLIHVVSQKGL